MPEEIVVGGIVRFLGWLLVEIFFEAICYRVGFLVARIVTLGKHPRIFGESEISLSFLGILVVFLVPLSLFYFFG